MVERFDPSLMGTREDWAGCVPCEDGEFVRYSDYAILSAKLAKAERERDEVIAISAAYNPTEREASAIMGEAAAIARVAELEKALDETAKTCGFWRDRAVASEAGLNELKRGLEVRIQDALATKGPKP
jgi:hypothetical protein